MKPGFAKGLGVFKRGKKLRFFLSSEENDVLEYEASGNNEFEFSAPVLIHSSTVRREKSPEWHDFRVSQIPTGYFLTFKLNDEAKPALHGAFSSDLAEWHDASPIANITESGMVVPHARHRERHIMFFGETAIRVAFSADLHHWRIHPVPVLEPRRGFFDEGALQVGNVSYEREGIYLLYYTKDKTGRFSLGAALFDKHDPNELLWRADAPLWQAPPEWQGKNFAPLGIVEDDGTLTLYWESAGEIFAIRVERKKFARKTSAKGILVGGPELVRFHGNPILSPRVDRKWDSKAAFNPTAFVEDGVIHIIYRAIGDNDVSSLGYATTRDGVHIDYRSDEPIYVPTQPFEGARPGARHGFSKHESPYASGGGGWGGCEDPRVTKIGDRLYMTYVAYDGWSPPRVAMTSISLADFLARRWNWNVPVLISEPDIVNKNACILPEKVNGKYVIFHRVYPDMLIDYVDDLNFDGETKWLQGHHRIRPKVDAWDSRKLGVGGTPIKTSAGWLLIYQGVGEQDPGRYKIGAMLLDPEAPHVVLARAKEPILEPEEHYENSGHKWGVVYPCGAVVKDNELFVYYGGADAYTCVAHAPVEKFLHDLQTSESPKLTHLPVLSA